jgi:hypothetical protein
MLHAVNLKIIEASNEMIWNANIFNLAAWSEGGNAHPRSRFGLIDCDRKHLI